MLVDWLVVWFGCSVLGRCRLIIVFFRGWYRRNEKTRHLVPARPSIAGMQQAVLLNIYQQLATKLSIVTINELTTSWTLGVQPAAAASTSMPRSKPTWPACSCDKCMFYSPICHAETIPSGGSNAHQTCCCDTIFL